MSAANSRMSTPRLAAASCALGMLTYVGIRSLAPHPEAAARQALRDGPQVTQRTTVAADGDSAAAGRLLGPQDAGAPASIR